MLTWILRENVWIIVTQSVHGSSHLELEFMLILANHLEGRSWRYPAWVVPRSGRITVRGRGDQQTMDGAACAASGGRCARCITAAMNVVVSSSCQRNFGGGSGKGMYGRRRRGGSCPVITSGARAAEGRGSRQQQHGGRNRPAPSPQRELPWGHCAPTRRSLEFLGQTWVVHHSSVVWMTGRASQLCHYGKLSWHFRSGFLDVGPKSARDKEGTK